MILKNQIHSGWSEGIFIIESGFASIYENKIFDNNDGLVMYNSSPNIYGNEIKDNQRAGLICCGISFPKVEWNEIFNNLQSGILVRDKSEPFLHKNKIHENYY